MNRNVFNNQNIRELAPTAIKLGEVFSIIENEFQLRGEVVCQYVINGISVLESKEEKFSTMSVDEVKELEVLSQTPEKLIGLVVKNWIEKLPILTKSCDILVEGLRVHGFDGRMQKFVDLIDNCQLMVDSLISISSILKDNSIVISEEWENNELAISKAIGESLAAFEKRDFVQLVDVIEYEICHALQLWFETFKSLEQNLEIASSDQPKQDKVISDGSPGNSDKQQQKPFRGSVRDAAEST
jgi:hypothetical protein